MKFIVTLSLLSILFASIFGVNSSPVYAASKKWCGNSKVNVEITTTEGGKLIVTKASIVVPTSITSTAGTYTQQKLEDLKMIPKNQHGIIMTLDGPAQKEHLGIIYNYDEDDSKQIFIPYLYLSSIETNFDKFNVLMSRTFKEQKTHKFDFVPVADEFGTNLCDCQKQMFTERIKQNLTKRIAILTEIATQLNNEITSVVLINEEIKRLENTKIDTSLLENLTKQIPIKETQCKALDQKIDSLNSNQADDRSKKKSLTAQSDNVSRSIQSIERNLKQIRSRTEQNWSENTYTILLNLAQIVTINLNNIKVLGYQKLVKNYIDLYKKSQEQKIKIEKLKVDKKRNIPEIKLSKSVYEMIKSTFEGIADGK